MASARTIVVFPYYYDNPYLNLTYLASLAEGATLVPTSTLDAFVEAVAEVGAGDVVHVHWTNRIVQAAEDELGAIAALRAFREAVTAAKQRGAKVLWTVHNRIPHETHWFELEVELAQFLADAADRIVVLSPGTADVVADVFELPAKKQVLLPHPSYQGIYPPADAAVARAELGVDADLPTALFFGQMRAYKGVTTLLEAAGIAHAGGARIGLLLAGKTPDDELARVEAQLPAGVPTVREHGFIPDGRVSTWFGAADIAVFPYTDVLNSGSIHLAATLGVPVAIPNVTQLVEQFAGEDWVHVYDAAGGATALAELLSRLPEIVAAPNSSRAFAARISPYTVSERFAEVLAKL